MNSSTHRVRFPRKVKNRLFTEQRGKCSYCGSTHRISYLEIDHKYPLSRGGGNEISNLQLLCTPCNMRKGIQSDDEFRRRYHRLLPVDDGIPSAPIPQGDFSDETQRTRAPREVRSIYHERFSAHRARQGDFSDEPQRTRASREERSVYDEPSSADRAREGGGCSLILATAAFVTIALSLLVIVG